MPKVMPQLRITSLLHLIKLTIILFPMRQGISCQMISMMKLLMIWKKYCLIQLNLLHLKSRFPYSTRISQHQFPRQSRDCSSSASTSGTDNADNNIQQPFKIDSVEVVGSRQRKGDVSLSERLVGVQKYTVYKIKVWSGEHNWEVERRYRDFHTLHLRLKKSFADNGWTLPSPWLSVERESRKLFGNSSPDVIADRSVLIQQCLQSVIYPRFPSSSLTSFLSPVRQSA